MQPSAGLAGESIDEPFPLALVRSGAADSSPLVLIDARGYALVKRLFDVLFASVVLVLTMPLWLALAGIILATSSGPVLFCQVRVGRGGRPFTCLKFRSMVADADQSKPYLMDRNEVSGPAFKLYDDPRMTRLGRWLRRSSLDELPQLINVIRGEMSLVGPRPPLPEEVARYAPHHHGRLAVKPGLTCLWQVSGRSLIGFEEWVRLDLEYIRRRSFWFDLILIIRTIPAVLNGRGAY
ncbi:MAG: sugar transferase [Thermomicrobiales bacterium]